MKTFQNLGRLSEKVKILR